MPHPPKLLTPSRAAAALQIEETELKYLVAQAALRCGVLAPGWYGCARPEFDGGHWHGGMTACHPHEPRLSTYHFRCAKTGEQYIVNGAYVSQFWFLDHHDAYLLATSADGVVECTWLRPLDGPALHQRHPARFPWPEFVFALAGDQDRPRSVSWSNVWFFQADVDAYASAQPRPPARLNDDPPTPPKLLRDYVAETVARIEAWHIENGKPFDRMCMPGDAGDLLWLMQERHPEKFGEMELGAFRNHYAPRNRPKICGWPRNVSSQGGARSLYLEIFPELKRHQATVVHICK